MATLMSRGGVGRVRGISIVRHGLFMGNECSMIETAPCLHQDIAHHDILSSGRGPFVLDNVVRV